VSSRLHPSFVRVLINAEESVELKEKKRKRKIIVSSDEERSEQPGVPILTDIETEKTEAGSQDKGKGKNVEKTKRVRSNQPSKAGGSGEKKKKGKNPARELDPELGKTASSLS